MKRKGGPTKNLLIHSFKELTAKQRAFMWTYLDNSGHLTETCKNLKMNPDTYYKWMADPVFVEYHDFVINLCTESLSSLAFAALKGGLLKGDIRAVRTFYELRGKLKTHETKIDAKNIQYTVRFGNPEGAEEGPRVNRAIRPASEPETDME